MREFLERNESEMCVCVCVLGFGREQEREGEEESACMEVWEMHGCMGPLAWKSLE